VVLGKEFEMTNQERNNYFMGFFHGGLIGGILGYLIFGEYLAYLLLKHLGATK
jgi:glycerol uptake facilitator-like aquaporin